MFQSHALGIPTLKHFHYHWFWGLCYSKTPKTHNLGNEVGGLLNNEQRLSLMIKSHLLIEQHTLIRFFYWLFNINNYSYHFYLLAACKEHQQHLEEINPMETNNKGVWLLALAGVVLTYASVKMRHILKQSVPPVKKRPEAINDMPNDDTQSDSETPKPVDSKSVLVTDLMQPYLVVLGLQLKTGELLQFSDFKAACRACYLASHPDKPGGTKEQFCRVRDAADKIKDLIISPECSTEMDSLTVSLANLRSEIARDIAEAAASRIKEKAEAEASRIKEKAEAEAARVKDKALYKEELDAFQSRFKRDVEELKLLIALKNKPLECSLAPTISQNSAHGFFAPGSSEGQGCIDSTVNPELVAVFN